MEIKIEQLKKCFGEKVAVDIDLYTIQNGDMLGLVGNNGAGKTYRSELSPRSFTKDKFSKEKNFAEAVCILYAPSQFMIEFLNAWAVRASFRSFRHSLQRFILSHMTMCPMHP